MIDDEKQVRRPSAANRLLKRTCLPGASDVAAAIATCPLPCPAHPAPTRPPPGPAHPRALPCTQVIVAERGPLVWVFNFSPFNTYEGLQVRVQ